MRTVYIGTFIDTPGPNELRVREGAVLVSSDDGHGVIEKLDWNVRSEKDARTVFGLDGQEVNIVTLKDGESRFWFPGFIGIFGKSTLLDWLQTYTFPLESSLGSLDSPMYTKNKRLTDSSQPPNPLERARTIYSRIITRTLSYGTTTASYYATIHVPATNLLAKLAFERGQRAYIGRVCMDQPETCPEFYRDESTEETISKTISTIDYCTSLDPSTDLVAPIITPRFAPSCTAQTLQALGDLAQARQLRVQTHLSENTNELALVASLFPDARDYTDVYARHGLLTPRTILAHAIHLSEDEVQVIKASGAKISHCPASNTALGSGLCPVRKWLDAGLEVGLGTDVSGGYSASILEAARQACLVSRHVGYLDGANDRLNIGVTEALYLATVGGAAVVGMKTRLGLFEPGMLWDVQEIQAGHVVRDSSLRSSSNDTNHANPQSVPDISDQHDDEEEEEKDSSLELPVDIFGWEDWDEKIAKWVWNGDDRNVSRVWVGGRLVHER